MQVIWKYDEETKDAESLTINSLILHVVRVALQVASVVVDLEKRKQSFIGTVPHDFNLDVLNGLTLKLKVFPSYRIYSSYHLTPISESTLQNTERRHEYTQSHPFIQSILGECSVWRDQRCGSR